MGKIERSAFTTQFLPGEKKLPAWRESISTLFDIENSGFLPPEAFNGSLTSYLLNEQIMFTQCIASAQRFERSPLRTARDGLDYYLIQTHLEGSQLVRRAGKERLCRPGDLLVIDLADRHLAQTTDFNHLTLVVPRHLLAPHLLAPDSQEGRILRGDEGLTPMLINHMRSLSGIIHSLQPEEVEAVIDPTLLLLASTLNGSAESVDGGSAGTALSVLNRAKLEIEANLHRQLSVDSLCASLNLSRASLYRLFKPLGGVRGYIQERRLKRCALELTSSKMKRRPIYETAFRWGFSSEAHFSRAFKRQFGLTSSEARQLPYACNEASNETAITGDFGDRYYEQWLSDNLKR